MVISSTSAEPRLSAILVVGSQRERAQRVVEALCRQTAAAEIEIVVVDVAPAGTARLQASTHVPMTYETRPAAAYSEARALGVRSARAPVVAFIEDHCHPAPGWAEALLEAHRDEWAAVGFCFTNANPETWLSRAGMVSAYGQWMAPAPRGPVSVLPSGNISYKRNVLLEFDSQLERVLTPDFILLERLLDRGDRFFLESRAVGAHENAMNVLELARAHFDFSRLLGARRAEARSWGRARRAVYAALAPAGVPALSVFRLARSMRGRRSLWPTVLTTLPVYLVGQVGAGLGEASGYLLGEGSSDEKVTWVELSMSRVR